MIKKTGRCIVSPPMASACFGMVSRNHAFLDSCGPIHYVLAGPVFRTTFPLGKVPTYFHPSEMSCSASSAEMIWDKNADRSERAAKALYTMKKIDIKALQEAYRQN